MNKLLIATKNKGKIKEFRNILSYLPIELVTLSDVGIEDDIEESAATYKENSENKAIFYAKRSNLPSLADDGGLEVAALNNEPGVKSRRWLGHEASDEELIAHMQKISKILPDDNRKAWFRTVVSFALPNGQVWSFSGDVEGIIAKEPLMDLIEGYPYRSFFYLPEFRKYYHESQLSSDEQKQYNHRYKAIQKLLPVIRQELIS